ncbi:MAG: hypothetical protein JRJ29_19815 [Deltaproteobacteria bacterium]|nr:hypothetical protein [Deltaproteobacteria bacterium]
MVDLSTQDLEEVLLVGHRAFEFDKLDQMRSWVLHVLKETLRGEKSNFFLVQGLEQKVDFSRVVTLGIEEKFLRQYRQYYHQLDPFAKTLLVDNPPVLTTDALISYKSLVRTEYYHDFLRPQSIHYQMVIYLKSLNKVLGIVALFRPKNESNFSAVDKAKAELMAPYLAGALEKTIISEKLIDRECVIDSIIPDLPYEGIVILNDSFEPVYYNENAVSILSNLDKSGRNYRALLGPLPKEIYVRCKELVTCAKREGSAELHQCRFDLPSVGTREKISIDLRLIFRLEAPLFLLCLEPEGRMLCLSNVLREQGLTERELDVVFLLSKGLKNSEIAQRLFISPYTVDNHLKSIYRKVGVKNRTSLVHRLMHYSPARN